MKEESARETPPAAQLVVVLPLLLPLLQQGSVSKSMATPVYKTRKKQKQQVNEPQQEEEEEKILHGGDVRCDLGFVEQWVWGCVGSFIERNNDNIMWALVSVSSLIQVGIFVSAFCTSPSIELLYVRIGSVLVVIN